MRKKLFAVITAISIVITSLITSSSAQAENAKAAEIRDIFKSKTFYVEYEINKKEDRRALAVDGEKRKSFDCESRRSAALEFISNVLKKDFTKLIPEVYYDSKNYYQFIENKKALKANKIEMENKYVDPNQEWDTIPLRIKLPEEFGMFTGDESIKFVESGTKIIETKKNKQIEIPFDKYFKIIKSVTGENIAKKVYFVYYNETGELDKISTLTVDWNKDAGIIFAENESKKPNKQDYEIQTITIKKLTKELPKNVMEFPKGCKVYGPGLGNMNELLDQPPLLEEYK